jgi:hypothetical protein
MPESLLSFEHQDGPLSFPIERALYYLSPDGKLSCSIFCGPNNECDYMSAPLFSAHGVSTGSAIRVGQLLQVPEKYEPSQGVEPPRTHLYAGTHYNPWNTRLEIVSVGPATLSIHASFVTPDPTYYDARAKDTCAAFFAVFVQSPLSELWSPY